VPVVRPASSAGFRRGAATGSTSAGFCRAWTPLMSRSRAVRCRAMRGPPARPTGSSRARPPLACGVRRG